jgi:aliphatic sulfonates family ABC transporter substrate-binding protein
LKFILGREKGWWDQEFARDGIKVEYYPFSGGGQEAMTALATGGLDITYTASTPALRTAGSGADVKLIGLSSYGRPGVGGNVFAVRKDSQIYSVKDLKGKKVAFLTGTSGHSSIAKALKFVGLSLKDIQGLNLASEASGMALVRGDIDAISTNLNTVTPLLETGAIRVVLDQRPRAEWANPSAISANGDFLKKHPSLVKRFLKIDLEAARWADAHPAETIKIYSEATRKIESAVKRDYPDNKFYQYPKIVQRAIEGFKAEEEFLKEAGLANGSVDYATWIDSRLIDEVYAGQGDR